MIAIIARPPIKETPKNRKGDNLLSIGHFLHRLKKNESLKHKSYLVFFLKLIGIGIILLQQVCLARMMGEEQYGNFIFVLNWIYLLVLAGKSGFDSALLRFIPEYTVLKQSSYARGFLARSLQITLFLSIVIALIMTATASLMLDQIEKKNLLNAFYLGGILLPLLALLRVSLSGIQAHKQVITAQLPEEIFLPFTLIIVVVITGKISSRCITSQFVIICMSVITCFALIYSLAKLFFVSSFFSDPTPKQYDTAKWIRAAVPLMIASGMILILGYLDTIMIGILIDPVEAGIYSVASRVARFSTFLLVALNNAVAPYVSTLFAERNNLQTQLILTKVTVASFIFGVFFYLIMIIWGNFILGLFSNPFVKGYYPMLILLAGCMVSIGSGSVGLMANIMGKQDTALIFISLGVFMNIILNFLLIPQYHMIGASIATAISMSVWNLGLAIYIKLRFGIDTSLFSVRGIFK